MIANKIKNFTIFVMIFSFYSLVFSYLVVSGYSMFAPVNFIALSIVLTAMIMLYSREPFNFILLPIYRWMLFYFIIILLWMLLPNSYATDKNLRAVLLAIIFLFTMTALMYFDDDELSMSRKAILFVTIMAVFNNIYEFFNPWAFYQVGSDYNIVGRSAGFYINSNKASEAILLGLILSYSLVYKKLKTIFLVATFIGVLVTFSRAGIASWFIIVFILSIERVIDKKNILLVASFFGLGLLLAVPILIGYIESDLGSVSSNLINRLNFFSSSPHSMDGSERERLAIAIAALNVFADNVLFGGGIFLTNHWHFGVSTHNIYLKLMAEFGILGFFIFPLLVLSSVWQITGKEKKIAIAFVIYILITGLTTHNLLDEYHFLIAFALMANLSYKNRITIKDSHTKL
jgi:O-antigen ligase